MAYFSNGSEGMMFEEQCARCKYGQEPCPIAGVQLLYNYDAVNNDIASKILEYLVHDDGTCEMFCLFEKDFAVMPY
jgi:hypothetical protein